MRNLARTILLIGLLLISAQDVYPCTCTAISQRRAFKQASAVFVGEVVEINDYKGEPVAYGGWPIAQSLKLRVVKSWKGAKQPEVTVLSDKYHGMCGGFYFHVGEKYLLYAVTVDGKLVVYSTCAPSRPLNQADKEIGRLNDFWYRLFARINPF